LTLKQRVLLGFVLLGAICSALAQPRGGAVTIHYTLLSPLIALLAGILILIMPRILNFVVAIYLIIIGLIGLFGI
jgi:Protein of unknown function (DUF3096)